MSNTLAAIREAKSIKIAECRAILSKAENESRSLDAEEAKTFDAAKANIVDLESQEQRAAFMAEAERSAPGETIHGDAPFAAVERRVSLLKVIQAQTEGRALSGAEAEYGQEIERRTGRKAQGIFVPLAALEQRTNTTTTASDLVGTDHRGDQYIEPFRNSLKARALGVRVLSGSRGNVEIPKAGNSTTAGWVAENAALSASDMTFGSVTLTPKHVGALSEMSRQLIQQSDPSIEQLLRNDLAYALAQAIDTAIIAGTGTGAQPKGILATSGVQAGSLATPDWTGVLAMLAQLEAVNATPSAWLTSPAVATKLRGALKSATAGANYLLESGRMADLPVAVTNQVPNKGSSPAKGQIILGDFSQVLLGIWSELDIVVNPYAETAYNRGGVLIRAMATCDVAIRHPEAFSVASNVTI